MQTNKSLWILFSSSNVFERLPWNWRVDEWKLQKVSYLTNLGQYCKYNFAKKYNTNINTKGHKTSVPCSEPPEIAPSWWVTGLLQDVLIFKIFQDFLFHWIFLYDPIINLVKSRHPAKWSRGLLLLGGGGGGGKMLHRCAELFVLWLTCLSLVPWFGKHNKIWLLS